MFLRADDKITSSQAAVFLTNTLLGAGILTMPRSITQEMKTPDSWLTILLGGAAIMLVVLLMVKLSQQFPGETIFQYAGKIAGRVPGGALCLLLVLYFVIVAGFEIRSLAEVTLFFLLEGTPIWAMVIPFIWAGAYLVCGGINAIARVYQIVLPITILVLLVSYAVSLRLFNINNLRPVLGEGFAPVFRGLKSSILVYSGCEVVLTLVAFMQHPQHAVKAMLGGIAIPLGLYLLTVIMVVGGLSIDCVITSAWPTIDLIRSFEVTGFFVERLEFPLMVVWLIQMFCTFCSFFFQASLGISQVFRLPVQPVILAMVPVLFLATMVPKSQQDLILLGDAIGWGSAGLFLLLFVPLLVVWMIRVKGLKQHV
ncbi:GerAB/ArcD/ProY family transporter [Paenibacillus sp. YN15]|uniref:GerAB/ArcD/ProY family transporter n=1 Tax=Paenibacillus sp. YN15 TaxID=1742774 RepID=UPI000DCAFF3C|nr:GerAB/ArcD/ProY family transporter [Paenibacillus sp. YN15]RAU97940.1 spore gernimation protein [Paenibacillus sp. YN15]